MPPSPLPIPPSRPRRGFSFIELMLVLAITATLALIAIPRFATAGDAYRVDAAVNRVLADLTLARAMARTEDRDVTVAFEPNRDEYSFDGEPDPDGSGEGDYTVDLRAAPYDVDLAGASFDGKKSVAFDRYGAPVTMPGSKPLQSEGTITLARGLAVRVVVVDPSTGRARPQ